MAKLPNTLDELVQIPFSTFRSTYSKPVNMEDYHVYKEVQASEGLDKPIYPVTNELDFASFSKKVNYPQGGIHLGIAGGLQPFLYQSLQGNPDISIACDISAQQIDLLEDTLSMIKMYGREDFIELFVQKYADHNVNRPEKVRNIWNLFNSNDFTNIREKIEEGKYKAIEGDFVKTALPLTFDISKRTKVPIKIIYLSSIRDMAEWQVYSDNLARQKVLSEYKKMDTAIMDAKDTNIVDSKVVIIEYDTDFKRPPNRQKPKTIQRRFVDDSRIQTIAHTIDFGKKNIIVKG
jgi:hypothetical protein